MKKEVFNMYSNEFKQLNPSGTVRDFTKYVNAEQKKGFPKCWWAGSPEPEVGDLIIQETYNSSKIKLPICKESEFGVHQQLLEMYSIDEFNSLITNEPTLSDKLITICFIESVFIYKRIGKPGNFILVIINPEFNIDKTIPDWIFERKL